MNHSENNPLEIDISAPTEQFKYHLGLPRNRCILFSGAFGSGKTYFLKKFFSDPEKYLTIRLSPANYSVASNEDIFDLVKFDILYEILTKGGSWAQGGEHSKLFGIQFFKYTNPTDAIEKLLEVTSRVGKNPIPIISHFRDLLKEVNLPESSPSEPNNVWDDLSQRLSKIKNKKGSIYEQDALTQLIYLILEHITKERESILIIDDLDRIDPEHIFRLLNIFSAHIDIDETGENKFGFSRVILVADAENLRHVFHARFGTECDFSGYIDKFYSQEVFFFDNRQMIEENIEGLINSIKSDLDYNMDKLGIKQQMSISRNIIIYTLTSMVRSGAIQIRSLIKLHNMKLTYNSYKPSIPSRGFQTQNDSFIILMALDFIKRFIGNGAGLRKAIKKCAEFGEVHNLDDRNDQPHRYKMEALMPFLDIKNHGFRHNYSGSYQGKYGITIDYDLSTNHARGGLSIYCTINNIHEQNNPDSPAQIHNWFPYLLDVIDYLQSQEHLK